VRFVTAILARRLKKSSASCGNILGYP
jgi:hypothetical protein